MVTTTGCEKRKCQLFDKEKGSCTDDDPRYERVCRYNSHWSTEEGQAELAAYEPRGNDPAFVSFNDMRVAWQLLAKVNPDNPMAVAEAVPELVTALEMMKKVTEVLGNGVGEIAIPRGFFALWNEAEVMCNQTLAKIRAGGAD